MGKTAVSYPWLGVSGHLNRRASATQPTPKLMHMSNVFAQNSILTVAAGAAASVN